jgi:excisionase family DNA binding protein
VSALDVTITLTPEMVEMVARRAAEIVLERTAADRGDAPEYMSVKDASVYLGCTEGRVRKLVERSQIPFTQDGPGCRVFLSRRDLDRWMSQRRV